MKKRFLFCLLCCTFLLSGCSQKNIQETVMNTYDSFLKMYMDVWVIGPKTDNSEIFSLVEDEEPQYYKVDDERIRSLEDITKSVEEICSKNCAEELFYKPYLVDAAMYIEQDGVLYRKLAEITMSYGGEFRNFKILVNKEDYISANIEFYNDLINMSFTIEISISLQNEKWIVDSLRQTWL